ncbi:MAG: fibrobacter succinogenes major paralogous domain-containing protein [candidate division Zixibacteria bacterium]|nr:fibrobacter succinogenes major paralogous domain-containing protein [candidate division Zixibacteria bacterium]
MTLQVGGTCWYAVADSRNISPTGWHVPSDAEWQTLINYLGGNDVAGGKMKEAGTTHWRSPNLGATNESGLFSALPGSYRDLNGSYLSIGCNAHFWSSTESYSNYAWNYYLDCIHSEVYRSYYDKPDGFSVRCVRDY